jgi:hypothetical protein
VVEHSAPVQGEDATEEEEEEEAASVQLCDETGLMLSVCVDGTVALEF